MEFFKKLTKYHFIYKFLILSLFNLCFTDNCPRNKPILKSNICNAIYCSPEEYSTNTCIISNEIIKSQWLNKFHTFDKEYMYHISVTQNYKGELFLSSQKVVDDFDKYLFAFDSEGQSLFYDNKTEKYTSFEIIDFETREYADYNNYIEIDGKGYLIGVPTNDDIYLTDYMNKIIKRFSIMPISQKAGTVFKMHNSNNLFFTAYIFCIDEFKKNCFLHFQSFKLNLTKLERFKNITNIPTYLDTRVICFQNDIGYIFCFYSKKIGENKSNGIESAPILEHYLSVINPILFEFEDSILIESNFMAQSIFDETLHLKKNLYIIAYAIDDEVIKVQFKTITVIQNLEKISINYIDYFSNIKEIYINKDRKFDLGHGSYKTNSLCKINENKFVILIKDYSKDYDKVTNSILLIYIFSIFNNDKNINIRRYSIDFELYNKHVNDDVKGYTLGNFFGIVLGLTKTIDDSQSTATFLTFGYVNTTEQENIDTKLKYNDTNSKIIVGNYINEIENNLFGYDFLGVKIISLPAEKDSGYFVNNINNEKIEINDTISKYSELQFILSEFCKIGVYSVQFAGIVKEPDYEKMNEFSEEIFIYPENQTEKDISEKEFYIPKIFLGKKMNYKFILSKCYDSCSNCTDFSEDENDQKCINCRDGFYFKEGTNNCYDKIDTKCFFDDNKKVFSPCYKDCLTCSKKENNPKDMNCLSCDNKYKYYKKSKNCLNCPKYVNLEQNDCLDKIENGYYLEDKEFGILGKCHYLCLTCIEGPYILNSKLHMNCATCLYKNNNFKKTFDGDCPDSSEIINLDTPVGGKCPIDKPILKNGTCDDIFCTKEEYENQICKIYNPIIETQWLNNFHIFSDLNNSAISFANDIISNEKYLFFAQSLNKLSGYTEKYLFGFYKNGTGIFYNKNTKNYESFKKFDFPDDIKLIDKIGYLEMDYMGYILTSPILNNLYIINYEENKIIKKEIDIPAFSTDKIILIEKEDETTEPDYTISYIYCKDITTLKECYLMMKNFEADAEELTENSSMKPDIRIHYNSQLNCFKDEQNYIKCLYIKYEDDSNYKQVLGILYSGAFELIKEFELEDKYNLKPTFNSMVLLKNQIIIIAYSMSDNKNIIKILIKKISGQRRDFNMVDYIPKIPEILLNEDNSYIFEGAKASDNSLVRISYEKFALLVKNFKDNNNNYCSKLVIFILTIYEAYSKVNIRHYQINFNLYNTLIDRKIIGYNFNGFLGALVELTSPGNEYLKRASFFIFGYVNSTNDIDPIEGNDILMVKKEKIKINNYINTIENNIFGYELSGIRIISVPDEKSSGYFTLNYEYNKLKPDDTISISSEISFIINDNPQSGNYSIVFAPIIMEPRYDAMNSYCHKIETYPKNLSDTEKNYYIPGSMLGKYFTFNFYIKKNMECFDNCEVCYEESKDIKNQKCIECKKDYYKINGTDNCFNKISSGYYFDIDKQLFMPCYKDCLSCNDSGTETRMNCLSCDNDKFIYYNKSTNCLNCPKYIDYSQTKCINEIPDGYFLDNKYLGTIEKCYELCKTCEKKSIIENGQLYMNCKTCKYNNNSKIQISGNCPDTEEDRNEDNNNEDSNDINKNDESKVLILIISISIVIIILIIIVIIVYKKCYIKNNEKDKDDYFTMKGKNIKLEDENEYKIN